MIRIRKSRTQLVVGAVLLSSLSGGVAHADVGQDQKMPEDCIRIGSQTFCPDLGFVTESAQKAIASEDLALPSLPGSPMRLSASSGASAPDGASGGDLGLEAQLHREGGLTDKEQRRLQDQKLAEAADAAVRLSLVEHITAGGEVDEDYLRNNPGASALISDTLNLPSDQSIDARAIIKDPPPGGLIPASAAIMAGYKPASVKQEKAYWCGPASVATIANANGVKAKQATWASRLGTTTSGTGLDAIVRTLNQYTTWDNKGGSYAVVNVSGRGEAYFANLVKMNVGVFKRPVVLHPTLRKSFFPYLKYDHGGHFQIGRGYNASNVQFIEVYNEADWYSSASATAGYRSVSWKSMYNSTTYSSSTFLRTIGA